MLAARAPLHRFIGSVLTEREMMDGLIFAGATLVVLPVLPEQSFGPYQALNLRSIWLIVILVMAVSAGGYIAVRILGDRFGLSIAGLASGFISSVATIGAMGARASATPALCGAAVAGAALSTVATIVQMGAVLAVTSTEVLRALMIPLLCAGLSAAAFGTGFALKAWHETQATEAQPGHAFNLLSAAMLAATLSVLLVVSAGLRDNFGEAGVVVGAAVAGFVDTHAAAVSIASLVATAKMDTADATFPILAALSTNTVSKIAVAWISGSRSFAFRLIPGLILVIAAAWAGALVPRLIGS
jgi:uncharacterized membrane protein (DUF4010 family)